MDKHCANCKYLTGYGVVCSSPKNPGVSLVTGTPQVVWAIESRKSDGFCGLDGKLFVPKDTTHGIWFRIKQKIGLL